MVVEASPAAALEVTQPEFLFELAIIALDAPAQLGRGDETAQRRVDRESGQPIFERLGVVLGPLDQQPFFGTRLGQIVIARSRADAHGGEPRGEIDVRSFAPHDGLPGLGWQLLSQGLGRERLVITAAPHQRRRAPGSTSGLGRQRRLTGPPDAQGRLHADDIIEAEFGHASPEGAIGTIACISQDHSGRSSYSGRGADLRECDLRLGLEDYAIGILAFCRSVGSWTQCFGK